MGHPLRVSVKQLLYIVPSEHGPTILTVPCAWPLGLRPGAWGKGHTFYEPVLMG